jgi:hypothetical protein
MAIRSPALSSVRSILKSGLDRATLQDKPSQGPLPLHDNVRGPDYYH